MFVMYEPTGSDDGHNVPTWMGSSRVELFQRVQAMFAEQRIFSAADVDPRGKAITLAYAYEHTPGDYRTYVREDA